MVVWPERERVRNPIITRKGGKVVTISLALRITRAIDLATGEHTVGPLFITAEERGLDRHSTRDTAKS